VRGKVLFQNSPPEGATVVFQPVAGGENASLMPSGTVDAKGEFTLSTHPYGPGAPAGEYNVVITWFPPNARELDNPVNKLPARYGDQTAKLLKAKVNNGPTELDTFRLTK
jgi:hypothetical protein